MMTFINQFNDIIKSPYVNNSAKLLLEEGNKNNLFVNYFGVNYNEKNIVSVKLYFSFFNNPSEKIINEFLIPGEYHKLIAENWKPALTYTYLHQGLTFGLKCYLKDNKPEVNRYIHFRTKHPLFGLPNDIKLSTDEDTNLPGICIEFHKNGIEKKKYFYIHSIENKTKLIKDFGLSGLIRPHDINSIEFSESTIEKKINLGVSKSEDAAKIIESEGNQYISELSAYFYKVYRLYYFAPGFRLNSNTRAIYYVPKDAYYKLMPVQTLHLFF